jgi:hypothetical protein
MKAKQRKRKRKTSGHRRQKAAVRLRAQAGGTPPPAAGQATDPSPANGATGVQRGFDLYAWLPEQPAKIYWGDSPATLAHLTDATGPNIGLLGALMLMQLEANTTYYWRVDRWDPCPTRP